MHIFISHATEDVEDAKLLTERLRQTLPQLTFFLASSGGIQPGEEWWASIQQHLRDAAAVVLLLSRRSVHRPWLFFEGGAAWGLNKPLIPALLDDLPPAAIPPPLGLLQAIRIDTDPGPLVTRLSEITGLKASGHHSIARPAQSVPTGLAPGIYLGERHLSLDAGWIRYSGSHELHHTDRYIDPGASFDDGHRFPYRDELAGPVGLLGFRVQPIRGIDFYAACLLVDHQHIKVYASTSHGNWGFTGTPRDEFRVPLQAPAPRRWCTYVIDLVTFEAALGAIQAIVGFRFRGGARLSHIWCYRSGELIPHVTSSDVRREIRYPA